MYSSQLHMQQQQYLPSAPVSVSAPVALAPLTTTNDAKQKTRRGRHQSRTVELNPQPPAVPGAAATATPTLMTTAVVVDSGARQVDSNVAVAGRRVGGAAATRTCEGQCGRVGRLRRCDQAVLCDECRQRKPYRMICRSTVKALYGVETADLIEAAKAGHIRVFRFANPYNKVPAAAATTNHSGWNVAGRQVNTSAAKAPPVSLYYAHEIEAWLERQRDSQEM